jgi:crossover junction endodeoxyribonuclease RuvC
MRVIGIDPGTLNTGYGILEEDRGRLFVVTYGAIAVSSKIPLENRLFILYTKLNTVFDEYQPEEVAIEEPFVAGNVKSAFAIGRAQAVAMLTAVSRKLPIARYLPTQVKQQVTNYGGSSKEQVSEMVRIQLGMRDAIKSTDASDALAIAICHINQSHLNRMIQNNS